jgi:hypothetical protein
LRQPARLPCAIAYGPALSITFTARAGNGLL